MKPMLELGRWLDLGGIRRAPRWPRRLVALLVMGALLTGTLVLRLVQLQVGQSASLAAQATGNRVHRVALEAERGIIYDRHGAQLVVNRPAWTLSVIPAALDADARLRQAELAQIAQITGVGEPEIRRLVTAAPDRYAPAAIQKDVDPRSAEAVQERLPHLPGVRLDQRPVRTYVEPLVFGHILGYTAPLDGEDLARLRGAGYRADQTMGKAGVEAGLESVLRGRDGWADVEYDAAGQTTGVIRQQDPEPGSSVYLSIDAGLQREVTRDLNDTLRTLGKPAGAAVVTDPQTGELLALASEPSYDTNLFTKGISGAAFTRLLNDPGRPLYDRAVTGLYPPGSTFKMVTAAAGLQEGKITSATSLGCPAAISYGGWTYQNWAGYDMGAMNVVKAIAVSCDTFFYRVADSVGDEALARYARAFGYGRSPLFQIPGAAAGVAPDRNWLAANCQAPFDCRWNPGETLTMGIGQSFLLTTPLIQSMYVSALANGGTVLNPNLVSQVRDAGGRLTSLATTSVVGEVPVSAENLAVVREGMHQCLVDPHGTGYQFRLDRFSHDGGCKTGTAQFGGSGLDLPTHAWFTFFTPYQKPEMAMVVLVEAGGEGDQVAEPIAVKVADYYYAHRSEIRTGR